MGELIHRTELGGWGREDVQCLNREGHWGPVGRVSGTLVMGL